MQNPSGSRSRARARPTPGRTNASGYRARKCPLVAWLSSTLLLLGGAGAHAEPLVNLLTFQDSPDPVPATGTLTYHLIVANTDFSTPAAGVVLTVPIPAGTAFVAASDASCAYDGQDVVCSIGALPANTNKVIDIELTVTAPGGTVLNSTAVVSSTTPGETDDSISQNTSVAAGADLQLSMLASPASVVAGAEVTFSMTATNAGPDGAMSLSIENTLPPNVTYVSSSGSGWNCSPGATTVICTRPGTLANGDSSVVSIVGRVESSISGTLTSSATLSAATPDGVPGDNTTTASVNVVAGADLRVTKSASPLPMIGGAPATFTLAPRNFGPDTAATVSVTDTLPAGFTAITASGPGWSCSVDQPSRQVICTRTTMDAGATDNITVSATAPDDSVVPPGGMSTTNTATIGSSVTADPDLTNNSGSVTFPILRDGADLSIAVIKSPDPVAAGTDITSTITVHNSGPRSVGPGDVVTVTTTLPAGEDYSGPGTFNTNGWSCSFTAGAFTCTRNGPLGI
ncbi:MAG TPA: DUF11 domain-containing protein, partial [Mycobacterium sp.]|nr:DUF11 domain-containing protein [Mycobacterium sp.]